MPYTATLSIAFGAIWLSWGAATFANAPWSAESLIRLGLGVGFLAAAARTSFINKE